MVYDITFRFAHKFLSQGDRTIDQMIQAARSGKKNILEGSKAARTSKETEIKLTSVARSSLEELLDDYRDYLDVKYASSNDSNRYSLPGYPAGVIWKGFPEWSAVGLELHHAKP